MSIPYVRLYKNTEEHPHTCIYNIWNPFVHRISLCVACISHVMSSKLLNTYYSPVLSNCNASSLKKIQKQQEKIRNILWLDFIFVWKTYSNSNWKQHWFPSYLNKQTLWFRVNDHSHNITYISYIIWTIHVY